MQVFQNRCESALELTGALDINTADEVRKVLLECLEQHTSISVDLSKVESCDAAGVQLLLALEKSTESAGKPFSLVGVSEAFARDCASLGISMVPLADAPSAQETTEVREAKQPNTRKSRSLSKKKSTQSIREVSHA
jgi:anti-anti-sigma factor